MQIETLLQLFPDTELRSHTLLVPTNHTPLWHYWEEFVHKYLRTGKSAVTVKSVKDCLRLAVRKLEIYSIEDCNNSRLLEDALFELKAENQFSNSSFNSYRKSLNTYFIWLEKQSYIAANNIRKVSKCKEEQNEQLVLSLEQIQAVFMELNDRRQTRFQRARNVLFFDLLRFTGARPCELLDIRMKDITKEKNGSYKLKINGAKQKGKPRYYALASNVRDSLERYMGHRDRLDRQCTHLLLSSSKQGKWTTSGMRKLLANISDAVGFKVTAYGVRRFVATQLYHSGMGLEKIKNYLGHTRISTTYRYIERSCALTVDCSEVMNALF